MNPNPPAPHHLYEPSGDATYPSGQPRPENDPHMPCKVCRLPKGNRKHTADDVVVTDTTYSGLTSPKVIRILEQFRGSRTARLVLHYGDIKTGRAWGDTETGYIGRSMGPTRVPLVIHNSRSHGGGSILDHCIVKIETARGKHVLYQHPQYTPADD